MLSCLRLNGNPCHQILQYAASRDQDDLPDQVPAVVWQKNIATAWQEHPSEIWRNITYTLRPLVVLRQQRRQSQEKEHGYFTRCPFHLERFYRYQF